MVELRTRAQMEEMRPAGRFVADVITALAEAADVGVNLLELDALAHRMIRDRGAQSCYIDYHPSFGASPFGKVLCTSVNDAVLHGLPRNYVLQDGDLLSLDFAASVNGWKCCTKSICRLPRPSTKLIYSRLSWRPRSFICLMPPQLSDSDTPACSKLRRREDLRARL